MVEVMKTADDGRDGILSSEDLRARQAIQKLLDGEELDGPADGFGPWSAVVAELRNAHAAGGASAVKEAWLALSRSTPGLADLVASGDDGPLSDVMPDLAHHLTDLGNARRLVERHGKDLHFCKLWNRWLVWDGRRWAVDETGEVDRLAKDAAVAIYSEASRLPAVEQRKAAANWAKSSESKYRRRAMIESAESEIEVAVRPSDFDRDPWLLNVHNGTLDLRTGELLPHRREAMITKLAPVEYDRDARCPLWMEFLNYVQAGNENMIRFLQRTAGYSLTGDTSEQCLLTLYGRGANGKTTYLETIRAMAGDYAQQILAERLMIKRGSSIPNDVAGLKGARLVVAAEAEEGHRLAESLIKQLTGGERVMARFLHAEWFEFRPEFKIFLATNHKPRIRGTDCAIWRRIRLVPFTVTIPEEEQDKHFGEKLLAELPGILAWAVRGCLEWQRNGLQAPSEVTQATQAYRDEMDILGDFIAECCILTSAARVQASKLYRAYKAWAEQNGERVMSSTRFGLCLEERGLDKVKVSVNYYVGIGLLVNEGDVRQEKLI